MLLTSMEDVSTGKSQLPWTMSIMQRLFSTFPDNWPGLGLILLRLAVGAPLLVSGFTIGIGASLNTAAWLVIAGCAAAILIVAGFWTPLGAATEAVVELWLAAAGDDFNTEPAIKSLIGVSLMMLGPGYYSIDARLYGRKRIQIR